MLCKEESPSRVSAITDRRDISLYDVPMLIVDVFARFRDRYDGQFPNMMYLVVVDCSVVYVCEVL